MIAGGTTVAFIFFASEHHWRRRLPEFFPEGDLRAVRRVPRLTVRVRLLAILLFIGLVPLAVLGMLAYTRAVALVGAEPAAAIGLSVFVANSVAAPLRDVEAAMAEGFNRMLHGLREREMDQAIRTHGGLVLQFIGDEIEAVFGAPIASRDHAARAVRAAIEMRGRLQAWNARRDAAGRPPLRNGIGIHTGTVLAGNIGGAERLSYALVGDPVNLASRIQGLTKDFKVDILISDATRSRLDGTVLVEELPAVRVKGRVEEVNVYKVV